jgi:hypothetical protein
MKEGRKNDEGKKETKERRRKGRKEGTKKGRISRKEGTRKEQRREGRVMKMKEEERTI